MKKFSNIEFCLEIHGLKNTYRAATRRITYKGIEYPSTIHSYRRTAERIDPVTLDSAKTELEFKISTGPEGIPTGGGRVRIVEFFPESFVSDLTGRDIKIESGNTHVEYEGRIANIIQDSSTSYVLTINFDRGELYRPSELPVLDRNTFIKYLTLSPTVTKTLDYVPLSDLNEDSVKPIGPLMGAYHGKTGDPADSLNVSRDDRFVWSDSISEMQEWKLGGTNRKKALSIDKDMKVFLEEQDGILQLIVPKKYLDMLMYSSLVPEEELKEGETVDENARIAKFNLNQRRMAAGKSTAPIGRIVSVKETGSPSSNDYKAFIKYEVTDTSYLLAYEAEAPSDFDKEVKDEDGNNKSATQVLTDFVTAEARKGKIFPYAFRYRNYYLVHEGTQAKMTTGSYTVKDYPAIFSPWTAGNRTAPPPYIAPEVIVLNYTESYYVFEIEAVEDLRLLNTFRLLPRQNVKSNTTGAGQNPPYSEENMFLQSFNQIGTLEDRMKFFDADLCKRIDAGNRVELTRGKWFLAMAQGVRTVKAIEVGADSLKGVNLNALINTRVDSVSANRKKSTSIQVLDSQSGSIFNKEYTFESIFEAVDGRFAFIEEINKVQKDKGGGVVEDKYEIIFNTTMQWQDVSAEPPIPNALFVDNESHGPIDSLLVVLNPLPENSPSEGEAIPIVYGYVEKFPAIQAISRKSNFGDADSAGDDVYLLCSNPLTRRDGNSVVVYWGLDEFASGSGRMTQPSSEVTTFQSGLDKAKKFWLPNPFPTVENIPSRVLKTGTIAGMEVKHALPNPVIEYAVTPHPFHYVMEIEDNNGKTHSAIKLRGDEYIPDLGELDPRHSIRFGLGSSKLYCTFVGMPDDSKGTITGIPGAPVINPAHILHHFVRHYGNLNSTDQIDVESFNKVYSLTKDLNCSFYVDNDEFNIEDALSELARSSFVTLLYSRGQYKAKYFNLDIHAQSLYTINDSDISNIESEVFFEGVTEYEFNYAYDFPTGKFSKSLKMNSLNNEDISKARAYAGAGKSTKIEFEFLFDTGAVKQLIPKYIDLLSGYRTRVSISVLKNKFSSQIEIFDTIKLNSHLGYDYVRDRQGFENETFTVYEIEDSESHIAFKLIQNQSKNRLKQVPKIRDKFAKGRVMVDTAAPFHPLDLNPVIFLDPTDQSTMFLDESGSIRAPYGSNQIKLWANKGTSGELGDAVMEAGDSMKSLPEDATIQLNHWSRGIHTPRYPELPVNEPTNRVTIIRLNRVEQGVFLRVGNASKNINLGMLRDGNMYLGTESTAWPTSHYGWQNHPIGVAPLYSYPISQAPWESMVLMFREGSNSIHLWDPSLVAGQGGWGPNLASYFPASRGRGGPGGIYNLGNNGVSVGHVAIYENTNINVIYMRPLYKWFVENSGPDTDNHSPPKETPAPAT